MDTGNTPDLVYANLPDGIGGAAVVWTPGMSQPELVSRDERAAQVEGLIEAAAQREKRIVTRQGNSMGVAHQRRPRIHVYRVVHVPPGVADQRPLLVKARSGEGAVKAAADHLGVSTWTIRLDDYRSAA